jgi:UDP-glucose 4-epimerase
MNILVTGGAGYIGSATAAKLVEIGHKVTVLDSLVTGHIEAVPAGAAFLQADLGDESALERAFGEHSFDAVMHFAAFIEAGESMKDPGKFLRNNLVNTLNLLNIATKYKVDKFVFSSTAAVFRSSDEPLDEGSAIEPANAYGFTKLAVEQSLEWYRKIHGLRYAILRYFNASGALPGRGEAHRPESHLIPRIMQVALGQATQAVIFGTDYPTPDGTCIRDYVHISDLVSAHILALGALNDKDKLVYCLGSGNGYSVREVIRMVEKVSGKPIKIAELERRPGDSARLIASSKRIKDELGWKPEKDTLEDIITSAWKWHSTHPNGYHS